MRRAVQVVMLIAVLGAAPVATSSAFAFDVQSGGVALSAQNVALLAERLAKRNERPAADTAAQRGALPGAAVPMGAAAPAGTPGAAKATMTRDERMMQFMLGPQPDARTAKAKDGLADLKALLKAQR
ncbi:hypothetical protein [Azospirillum agricola]|uniref:hypothetical protein n=1 Tax=Azospirillum agricola TaxID=1720247 RepID=UPI000A0F12CD|nr:hypothetical protein [Azospirillum agricola]SMH61980.1 hypothetical protein SAMN02982994_6086 [Azospirillum lipoferum]